MTIRGIHVMTLAGIRNYFVSIGKGCQIILLEFKKHDLLWKLPRTLANIEFLIGLEHQQQYITEHVPKNYQICENLSLKS